MKRFILLLNHDDISLSSYLQHCLDRGEQFCKVSSNIFTFRKKSPSKERIAAITYTCADPDLKMKFELEDYAALMKKRGWRTIFTGGPENLIDSKRHVFLQTDQPDIPFPDTNPSLAEKAQKRERRSLIRCFVMLLLLAGFMVFFLSHDPDVFLSSPHIIIACAAGFIFWLMSFYFCIRGSVVIREKLQTANGFRDYLTVDKAVLFSMLAVAALLAALLIDLFKYPDKSVTFVNREQRIRVYQDALPLHLEDLDIPAVGSFRSSRLTERSGFLMRSQYGSDQSFSDPNSVADLSLISWSVFQSEWNTALNWVAAQKGMKRLTEAPDLAEAWHSSKVYSDGQYRLAVRYPGIVLFFAASADITKIDADIVLNVLLPGLTLTN